MYFVGFDCCDWIKKYEVASSAVKYGQGADLHETQNKITQHRANISCTNSDEECGKDGQNFIYATK
jgi:hypothetical protein